MKPSETFKLLQAEYDALFAQIKAINAETSPTEPADPRFHQITKAMAKLARELHRAQFPPTAKD